MKTYEYVQAHRNWTTVFDAALQEDVFITRKDGSQFQLRAVNKGETKSPLDIEGIDTDVTTKEMIEIIRECREGFIS
jgi:hypothetical protein